MRIPSLDWMKNWLGRRGSGEDLPRAYSSWRSMERAQRGPGQAAALLSLRCTLGRPSGDRKGRVRQRRGTPSHCWKPLSMKIKLPAPRFNVRVDFFLIFRVWVRVGVSFWLLVWIDLNSIWRVDVGEKRGRMRGWRDVPVLTNPLSWQRSGFSAISTHFWWITIACNYNSWALMSSFSLEGTKTHMWHIYLHRKALTKHIK